MSERSRFGVAEWLERRSHLRESRQCFACPNGTVACTTDQALLAVIGREVIKWWGAWRQRASA